MDDGGYQIEYIDLFHDTTMEIVEQGSLGESILGNPVCLNTRNGFIYKIGKDLRRRQYEELWYFDLDTEDKRMIYKGIIGTVFPLISEDDSFIAFKSESKLRIIDFKGEILNKFKLPGIDIQLSPDSRYITAVHADLEPVKETVNFEQLMIAEVKTGEVRNLTPTDTIKYISNYIWVNDTTIVYY